MLRTSIDRLRFSGWLEGGSFLLLMFVAMPLKYFAGQPGMVRIVGMIHGILFLLYCLAIMQAWVGKSLSTKWMMLAFLASLLPFGPFFVDRHLMKSSAS